MLFRSGGALLGLLGLFFVYQYAGESTEFTLGGFLDPAKYAGHEGLLLAMVFLAIIGFGTKAGMYPMHGWLPTAHPIAPAPASSLLSGIIAKAGIIAVIRLVFFSVGAEFLRGTWVQTAWMCIASTPYVFAPKALTTSKPPADIMCFKFLALILSPSSAAFTSR